MFLVEIRVGSWSMVLGKERKKIFEFEFSSFFFLFFFSNEVIITESFFLKKIKLN